MLQAICQDSNSPTVVQYVDSGDATLSIRQQEFTALAPAYLGNIPVSVQQVQMLPLVSLVAHAHV